MTAITENPRRTIIPFSEVMARRKARAIAMEPEAEVISEFEILYADSDMIVINKPSGIPVTSDPIVGTFGVTERIREAFGEEGISPAHRLDQGTSGVFVLGRSRRARRNLAGQFKNRTIEKEYTALVKGDLGNISGIIAPLLYRDQRSSVSMEDEAKTAATAFQKIGSYYDSDGTEHSILAIKILTGRTHQIRAHLEYLECPIAGDDKYNPDDQSGFDRLMLHARRLTLTHPRTKERMTFYAQYPRAFREALRLAHLQ